MSYESVEVSRDDGSPQFLYLFELNDKAWRYTLGAERVNIDGHWWEPIGISDDGVKQKGDPVSDLLNVTVPSTLDIVKFYIQTPPSSPVFLTVRRYHVGDFQSVVAYVGEVSNVNQNKPGQAVVSCSTISASLDRNGLRLAWSRTCPHSLYDKQCRVNPGAYRVQIEVQELGPGTVKAPQLAGLQDGWFDGGYLEWESPERGIERRGIEEHLGDTILMFGANDGITPGLIAYAHPGCNRIVDTCRLKFNNIENYGGIPSMPGKSPFDGDPIY